MVDTKQYPTVILKPPLGFVNDKRTEGWQLIEDTDFIGDETLELAGFLEKDETYVSGEVMLERSKKNPRTGQRHAEQLLAQQKNIPSEWRTRYLMFMGTVWQYSDCLYVPCLYWCSYHKGWVLEFYGLTGLKGGSVFSGRLVRPCK